MHMSAYYMVRLTAINDHDHCGNAIFCSIARSRISVKFSEELGCGGFWIHLVFGSERVL